MKEEIKSIIRELLFILHQRKHEKFYHDVMKKNGIEDKPVSGEDKWMDKWSKLSKRVKPTQYRVFSHYIGNDVNIVPEDICHDYIEPILNPFRYVGYYSDKNVFDKLFPKGYLPKTLLRKIDGVFYDDDYRQLNLTNDILLERLRLSTTKKAILKPSVDGMSGKGVILLKSTQDSFQTDSQEMVDLSFLDNYDKNNFIIQEAVEQCDYLAQFNPTSVNTLRLSLYRSIKDNECYVTGAILRIGGKGSVVDNAHSGGGYVGIDIDGSFCHEVLNQFGQSQYIFNGIDFRDNFKYPNWGAVIDFGKKIGQFVPHHRLLALDIVLDKLYYPHLIEFNVLWYSSWLFQYTTRPAFGRFTDEIINYCVEHKKDLKNMILY